MQTGSSYMREVQMPEVNKVLQCTPFHDSRALPYFANSLILQAIKKYFYRRNTAHM